MDRGISDTNVLFKFCKDFCSIIEKHAEYIIVSGFLVIASGRARSTEDIDMILARLPKEKFVELHGALKKAGFECMQTDNAQEIYDDYLTKKASVRYTRSDIPLPEMEVKFAKDLLDDLQLKQRIKIAETNIDVWFSSVSANIAFKEEYLKSQKDLEDAMHLRLLFESKINEREINEIKKLIRKYKL